MAPVESPLRAEARGASLRIVAGKSPIHGTFVWFALVPSRPAPVGQIWFRFVGGDRMAALDVIGLQVEPEVRRCGVGRRMVHALFDGTKGAYAIVTGSLSRDGRKIWKYFGGATWGDAFFLLMDSVKDQARKASS